MYDSQLDWRWRDRSHVSTVGPVILLELYPSALGPNGNYSPHCHVM